MKFSTTARLLASALCFLPCVGNSFAFPLKIWLTPSEKQDFVGYGFWSLGFAAYSLMCVSIFRDAAVTRSDVTSQMTKVLGVAGTIMVFCGVGDLTRQQLKEQNAKE